MIRFDKLTLKGQEALQSAQSHAQEKANPQVTSGTSAVGVGRAERRRCSTDSAETRREYPDACPASCAIVSRSCRRFRGRRSCILALR